MENLPEVASRATVGVFGMEIPEEGALYFLHYEHETIYFCSKTCKENNTEQSVITKSTTKKGVFGRFLETLAKANDQTYGGGPPKCH